MGAMTKGVVAGLLLAALAGVAIWVAVAYTGAYNVAATAQHADVVRWTLETTQRNSVIARAEGMPAPEAITDGMIAQGARHFATTCAQCHGAPGHEPAPWSRGMRPEPPRLTEAATHWRPREIFWIVANGFRMTGMPAFGAHHSAEEIAAIAAFVGKLPGLTPDGYKVLIGGASPPRN